MVQLLAATRVDVNALLEDLASGDPVAWSILGVTLAFMAFGAYKKFASF